MIGPAERPMSAKEIEVGVGGKVYFSHDVSKKVSYKTRLYDSNTHSPSGCRRSKFEQLTLTNVDSSGCQCVSAAGSEFASPTRTRRPGPSSRDAMMAPLILRRRPIRAGSFQSTQTTIARLPVDPARPSHGWHSCSWMIKESIKPL